MTDQEAQYDAAMVRTWLDVLFVNTPGLIHISSTGDWSGQAFADHDTATAYVTQLDQRRPGGIYLRCTTLHGRPGQDKRGGDADTAALPGFWADMDVEGPGHQHQVCPDDCPKKHRHITLPLPPDERAVRKIIEASGLPGPTLWIHSGGGLYPWWLLDRAVEIGEDNLGEIQAISAQWQAVIAAAAKQLGWQYGPVGDLSRILRIPGTINRKPEMPEPRPCTVLDASPERYTLEQLRASLDAALAAIPETAPASARRLAAVPRTDGGVSPGDDFEARVGWGDTELLGGAGWRFMYERGNTSYWQRPGKTGGECSATTGRAGDRDRLFVFSTSTDFDSQVPYTKFGAYALLHHNSDHQAAARALRKLGYGTPSPLAPDPAAAQREMLAELLPPPAAPPAGPRVLAAVDGTSARVLAEPVPAPHAYGPTEDGMARALVAHHGTTLRYCPQRGQWLRWDGHRWGWDEAEHHRELIRRMARELPDDDGWRRFKTRVMSAVGVSGVERLARSDSAISVHVNALDARPYELNTPAGIVDLRTGQIRAPDPAALHTRSTTVAPDFDRRSEVFDRFLADTFADPDLAGYVQRLLGVSTIGTVLEQLLPFVHGVGANGKSTLFEAAMHVLGVGDSGYAMAAPAEMLMVRRHSEHPAELAQLLGARLVVCSELEDGQQFAEARIKQLTGRDSINARFMRRDPFTFTPSHTMWLLGNHKPTAQAGGPAFWRRVRLLPFTRVVPADQRDPRLGEKLANDGAAVLAWIIGGAADYHAAGLQEPTAVRTATAAYERDQDSVGQFVEDSCHVATGQPLVRVNMTDARRAYERWCDEAGEEPVTPKRFGMELRERWGVEVAKSNGKKFYTGLALLADESDPADEPASERYR